MEVITSQTEGIICTCSTVPVMDWVSIGIAALALFVAYLNYRKFKVLQSKSNELQQKYNDMVNTQMLTAQGALETQVRAAIADAFKQVADMALALQKDPGNERIQQLYKSAEEAYRNAYEDACAKYIDGKIDKERFRRQYLLEIRRLVEEEPHREAYATNQTAYDCTMKVYNEWHHPEREAALQDHA